MNFIIKIIEKESIRNDFMREYYKKEINTLPRGTITKKKVGNNEYYYLKYRSGVRTITDYIGKDITKVEGIKQLLAKRKHHELMLSELNDENELISKILEEAK